MERVQVCLSWRISWVRKWGMVNRCLLRVWVNEDWMSASNSCDRLEGIYDYCMELWYPCGSTRDGSQKGGVWGNRSVGNHLWSEQLKDLSFVVWAILGCALQYAFEWFISSHISIDEPILWPDHWPVALLNSNKHPHIRCKRALDTYALCQISSLDFATIRMILSYLLLRKSRL